jgi:hypothetical protein
MTSRIMNPANHRARIVAEAVVSAYIHEIAQPTRRMRAGDAAGDRVPSARLAAPVAPRSRRPSHALPSPRRRGLELVA